MAAPIVSDRRQIVLLVFFLAALCAVPLVWPGDTTWINDEPHLMEMALRHKISGEIAAHGLMGSRGVVYGPFPTWVYTALLHVSTDLVDIVRIRAFLVTLATAVSIVWIALLCTALRPIFGSLALLSPYLWLYSRQLWDNTFLIPLSAITLAAYISFCVSPRGWKIWLVSMGMAAMFLTHLMSVVLIAPILAHFVWFHRRWFFTHPWTMAAQMLAAAVLSWPYLNYLAANPAASHAAVPDGSLWAGWLFPFLGGQFFSAYGLDYFFGEKWVSPDTLKSSNWIFLPAVLTWIALPLVCIEMAMTVRRIWNALRSGSAPDAEFHLSLIALAAVFSQCLLNGAMRTYGHPHYFNATWFCFFYFFWKSLSSARISVSGSAALRLQVPASPTLAGAGRISASGAPSAGVSDAGRVKNVLAIAHAASLGAVLAFLILNIHASGGNREIHFGPTLKHQIDVARKVNTYHPDSPVYAECQAYILFPHALSTLESFYGLNGTDAGPRKKLLILPLSPDRHDGWLTIQEMDFP